MVNPTEEKKVTAEHTAEAATAPRAKAQEYKLQGNSGYNTAMQTLQAAEYTAPSFSSDYDQTISELYDKITTREPFRYDYSNDPLYGQYKEAYTTQGRQAMRDTVGQAASLTGGYGNSYGQAVGQQQYDAYLQRLNDVMPDLYNMAYAQYAQEGNNLKDAYSMANAQRQTQYGEFRDAITDKRYADAQAIQEAEIRAQGGDFSGYAALYGDDTAHGMALAWAAAAPTNGQIAFDSGNITGDEYFNLYGSYPRGYQGAGVASGGYDPWGYGGAGWNPTNGSDAAAFNARWNSTPAGERSALLNDAVNNNWAPYSDLKQYM